MRMLWHLRSYCQVNIGLKKPWTGWEERLRMTNTPCLSSALPPINMSQLLLTLLRDMFEEGFPDLELINAPTIDVYAFVPDPSLIDSSIQPAQNLLRLIVAVFRTRIFLFVIGIGTWLCRSIKFYISAPFQVGRWSRGHKIRPKPVASDGSERVWVYRYTCLGVIDTGRM